jgi:tetratricopeptide (TPR) repeat protein
MHISIRTGSAVLAALAMSFGGCKSSNRHEQAGIPADAKVEEVRSVAPDAKVHIAAGDFAVNQGNRVEAIRQYEKALQLDPTGKIALYKMATLYTYDGQFDLAVATWQKYVDATNQSAGAYVNLGRANELAGKWKAAEVAYLRAINRESMNRAARVNYGILLAKRDRLDEAETQLGKVLRPEEVQYNLGSVHELRRDFAAASAAYTRAVEIDGNFTPARQRLSMLKSVTAAQ